MARVAQILYQTPDHWGDLWDIREERPTQHGWMLLIGWPSGAHRGRAGRGVAVVITSPLVAHLGAHRRDTFSNMGLPVGVTTIKRLRHVLGHHRYLDAAAWWEERIADLSDLTIEAFAQKFKRTTGAVERARLVLLGRTIRAAGWWRDRAIAAILLSDLPRAHIADRLSISVGSVGRLRWMLQTLLAAQPALPYKRAQTAGGDGICREGRP